MVFGLHCTIQLKRRVTGACILMTAADLDGKASDTATLINGSGVRFRRVNFFGALGKRLSPHCLCLKKALVNMRLSLKLYASNPFWQSGIVQCFSSSFLNVKMQT